VSLLFTKSLLKQRFHTGQRTGGFHSRGNPRLGLAYSYGIGCWRVVDAEAMGDAAGGCIAARSRRLNTFRIEMMVPSWTQYMLQQERMTKADGDVIAQYKDYECPICGAAYVIVKGVQQVMGDRLGFVFRNFPISEMHPRAKDAAQAAEATAAQGSFWEMHDMLFENQNDLGRDHLAAYAEALGLDATRLIDELITGTYAKHVQEDFHSGVNGTPTFFINGIRYDGSRDRRIHDHSPYGSEQVRWELCPQCSRDNTNPMTQAIAVAKELNDMHGLAQALYFSAWLAHFERNPTKVERLASEVIELSTRYNFAFWMVAEAILRGWARSALG
jgi:hypothetical protein